MVDAGCLTKIQLLSAQSMACQQGQQFTFQCLKARVPVTKLIVSNEAFGGDMQKLETTYRGAERTERPGRNRKTIANIYDYCRNRKSGGALPHFVRNAISARATRRLLQSAGRFAADPKADLDANHRK
jgi:hypothetical protein